MINNELEGLDFNPIYSNTSNKKCKVVSFSLNSDIAEKLDKHFKGVKYNGVKISKSEFVNGVLETALNEMENPVSFVGVRRGYKPVTMLLKSEIADFINMVLLCSANGLPMAKLGGVNPLKIADKVSMAIINAPMFLSGNFEIQSYEEFERGLMTAKASTKLMEDNL